MCLNYLSKPLPDHPFLSYGPSNTPSPRQEVQNDVFFKITTEPDIAPRFYGYPQKAGDLRYKIMKVSKRNLTQTKVFISVSAEDEYLHSTGLCTCLHGAIPALIAALPALIAALPAQIAALPALIATLPDLIATLPALIATLPAQIATLPAQIATLPEGERERARERERDRERERASEKVKERESEGERESTEVNPGFNPKPSNLKPKP